jgi:hypothetical protein
VGLGTQPVRFLLVELIHLYLNHIFDIYIIFMFNYSFNGRQRPHDDQLRES